MCRLISYSLSLSLSLSFSFFIPYPFLSSFLSLSSSLSAAFLPARSRQVRCAWYAFNGAPRRIPRREGGASRSSWPFVGTEPRLLRVKLAVYLGACVHLPSTPAARFRTEIQTATLRQFDAFAGSNRLANFRQFCLLLPRQSGSDNILLARLIISCAIVEPRTAAKFHPGFIDSTLTDNSLVEVAPFNLMAYMALPGRPTNMLSRRNRLAVLFAQICLRRTSRHAPFYSPNCKTIKNICVITR